MWAGLAAGLLGQKTDSGMGLPMQLLDKFNLNPKKWNLEDQKKKPPLMEPPPIPGPDEEY